MSLTIIQLSLWAFSGGAERGTEQAANTPIWVPIAILLLMLLLLVWGLTRGNVLNENLSHMNGVSAGTNHGDDSEHH